MFNSKTAPYWDRLFNYLATVQESGRAVFFEYSGHVDGIDIRIAKSPTEYNDIFYNPGYPTLQWHTEAEPEGVEKAIEQIIADIMCAIEEQNIKERELAELERLKEKYEPKPEEKAKNEIENDIDDKPIDLSEIPF